MSKLGTTLEKFRDQPDDELRQLLATTRDELFRIHLGQHTNQVTSTAQLQGKRRDIARIMTILRGRSLGFETQATKTATAVVDAAETTTSAETKTKTKKAKS